MTATDVEIPFIANFVADGECGPGGEFGDNVPNGQRAEIGRLVLQNFRKSYGSHVGRWRYPAAILVAEVGNQIVGYVSFFFFLSYSIPVL